MLAGCAVLDQNPAIEPDKIRSLELGMSTTEIDRLLGKSRPESTEMFEADGKTYELRRYLTHWQRHKECSKPAAECGNAYDANPHLQLFYLVFDTDTGASRHRAMPRRYCLLARPCQHSGPASSSKTRIAISVGT